MGMTTLCQEVSKALKEPNRPRSRRRPRPRKFGMRWSRKCGQGPLFVVPKGLMMVARQFITWNTSNRESVP
jgi:hypothetical protein